MSGLCVNKLVLGFFWPQKSIYAVLNIDLVIDGF